MSSCEIAKVYQCSEVVARKRHACCECSAPIIAGELHLKVFGIWSFGKQSFRQHLACMEACMLIRDELNDGECIGFGDLFEFIGEMGSDFRTDRDKEPIKRLRHLVAAIRLRERNG